MGAEESLTYELSQYRFLIELDDRLRPLISAAEITLTAATVLGQNLGVNRCAYADVEEDQCAFNLTGNYTNGVPSIVGRFDGTAFGEAFLKLSREGSPFIVEDAKNDPRLADVRESYRLTQICSVVSVPIVKGGKFVAGMAVHQITPRHWQPHEVKLIELVGNRCWESIERNRVTRELLHSEAKFKTIANALPQIVWTASADGTVNYYNEKWYEFIGTSQQNGHDFTWQSVLHPNDVPDIHRERAASLASGTPFETICRLRHHSGQYRWALVRALPVRDDKGAILHWIGTSTDIHEQKLAEETLKETNQRKDEFLAMLAHELRNPLAPISAAAELLSMVQSSDARVVKASNIIARQVRHVTSLVNDLLDVSRVTRGLVVLDKSTLDIKNVVSEAIEQVRPLIEQRNHRLSVHLSPESVLVSGDQKRLVQVISNLLNNAAKFTPEGGHIVMTMASQQSEVAITVEDDGIGMKPDLVERVFDLFRQGERTPDRSSGGLGIGLALVKSLIQQHHGAVTAESKGEGQGSKFTIYLPRVMMSAQLPADAVNPGVNTAKGMRLMVVDDNADAASTVAMFLQILGHEVVIEYDSEGALAHKGVFDGYLLDIGLPDIDGFELVRRLRARPDVEDSVFIAVTGYGREEDKKTSAAAGFHHHFVKPVDVTALRNLLATMKGSH